MKSNSVFSSQAGSLKRLSFFGVSITGSAVPYWRLTKI